MDLYLAGADSWEKSVALSLFKYPHRLASYLYLDRDDNRRPEILSMARDDGAEWIMDSGLFTLMFGAEQGTLTTFDQARAYAAKYVDTMLAWEWPHAIVECDVQRLLGVEQCHKLREEFFDNYPGEVIYVWHLPDGTKALAELAAQKARVAISVPELRMVLGNISDVRKALIQLLSIIRKAGSAKVHLLGCTESRLLDLPADSGDSTSWTAGGVWGKGKIPYGMKVETVSTYSPKFDAWLQYLLNHHRWSEPFAKLDQWVLDNRTEEQVPGATFYSRVTAADMIAYWRVMDAVNAR